MGRRFDSCPWPIAGQFESLETRQLLVADVVLQWNDVLLDAIRIDKTAPPTAARAMAIVQTAVFDAVKSIDRRPERGQADRFNRQPVAHGRPDRDRNGSGSSTPPGHWNIVAQTVAESQQNLIAQNARLFALLNLAMADAAILCRDAKYEFDL